VEAGREPKRAMKSESKDSGVNVKILLRKNHDDWCDKRKWASDFSDPLPHMDQVWLPLEGMGENDPLTRNLEISPDLESGSSVDRPNGSEPFLDKRSGAWSGP
jgi:hypothetical protein